MTKRRGTPATRPKPRTMGRDRYHTKFKGGKKVRVSGPRPKKPKEKKPDG